MGMHDVERFVRLVEAIDCPEALAAATGEISRALGFRYFALSHHVDIAQSNGSAIRLHNYPEHWQEYYDRHALGITDPVHRASHVTSIGFRWSRIPAMIPLTPTDLAMLAKGRNQGIGDGFTVPANVPGEAHGSCSFANGSDRSVADTMLPMAQLAGAFAFEGARRLWCKRRPGGGDPAPVLTDRQRDCVLWAARGKSDWEISRILGVSEETVIRHIKQARERYGVQKRTLLAIRTLFDGTLTFDDILRR